MQFTVENLYGNLLFSSPYYYTEDLILYPILMEDILIFSILKSSIIVRKNSIFPVKNIIKMSYLDFLFYSYDNVELAKEFDMPLLPKYYSFAFDLLKLVFKNQEVKINSTRGGFMINGIEITPEQFDDIRRIIILQNGIDFDIDEFINRDTEEALLKAQNATSEKDNSTLEDYFDSVCLGMGIKEEDVKKLSIRKFWRYVKRISKRDVFNVMKTAETSGMVKLKEPVEYWMSDIEINDKYKEVKTDTQSLQKMISG